MTDKFDRPSFLVAKVANPLVNLLVRLGLRPGGAATLMVRGRVSGKERTAPVNPMVYEDATYILAPRGRTEWVRNLRAAGEAKLRIGRRERQVRATEVPAEERAPLLKAYLERWSGVAGKHFAAGKNPSIEELEAEAADHPVFRLEDT